MDSFAFNCLQPSREEDKEKSGEEWDSVREGFLEEAMSGLGRSWRRPGPQDAVN